MAIAWSSIFARLSEISGMPDLGEADRTDVGIQAEAVFHVERDTGRDHRLDRQRGPVESRRLLGELLESPRPMALMQGEEQGLLRRKPRVEGAARDVRRCADLMDGDALEIASVHQTCGGFRRCALPSRGCAAASLRGRLGAWTSFSLGIQRPRPASESPKGYACVVGRAMGCDDSGRISASRAHRSARGASRAGSMRDDATGRWRAVRCEARGAIRRMPHESTARFSGSHPCAEHGVRSCRADARADADGAWERIVGTSARILRARDGDSDGCGSTRRVAASCASRTDPGAGSATVSRFRRRNPTPPRSGSDSKIACRGSM